MRATRLGGEIVTSEEQAASRSNEAIPANRSDVALMGFSSKADIASTESILYQRLWLGRVDYQFCKVSNAYTQTRFDPAGRQAHYLPCSTL